jgi:Ca2+-binding RTX toxin-like protein
VKTLRGLVAAAILVVPAAHAPAQLPLLGPECFGRRATIVGTDGDDVLTGTRAADVIAGLEGDDVIRGVEGGDALCGGDGDDEIEGGSGRDAIIVGRGADSGAGGPGFDFLMEFASDSCGPCSPIDPRSRDDSVDHISGGPGPDLVSGEGGNDVIDGGRGDDFVFHVSRFTSVTLDLGLGVAISSAGDVDELRDVEHAWGSVNADTIRGDTGANWLAGSLGPDVVEGGDGADTIWADLLGDVLSGGSDESSDTIRVALQEPAYVDLAAGTAASRETSHGHLGDRIAEFENAVGTPYDDVLVGDGRPNVLEGGYGVDELAGAGGGDRIFGDDEVDWLYWAGMGPGNDVLDGGTGRDRLDGGPLVDECRNGEVYVACEVRGSDDRPARSDRQRALPWWWSEIAIDYVRGPAFARMLSQSLR